MEPLLNEDSKEINIQLIRPLPIIRFLLFFYGVTMQGLKQIQKAPKEERIFVVLAAFIEIMLHHR